MKSRRLCSTLLHQLFIFPVAETIFDTRVLYSFIFVIFPVTKTIFGASGYFPVSQGQETSGHKTMRGCQCSFSAQMWPKNSHE